jgi:hypothetical protein
MTHTSSDATRWSGAGFAGVEDALVEVAVLPAAGDVQVRRCEPDLLEAGAAEDALGGDVVRQRARLDTVQAELGVGDFGHGLDRPRRQPAAHGIDGQPVAEAGAAEWSGHDVVQRDRADEAVALDQQPRDDLAVLVPLQQPSQPLLLAGRREPPLRPIRFPRPEVVPATGVRVDEAGGVVEGGNTELNFRRQRAG